MSARVGTIGGLALLAATAVGARTKPVDREPLLTVATPASGASVIAHPHVNVTLGFGAASNGLAADPSTLRVRLNGHKANDVFTPIEHDGAVVGMRGRIPPALLHLGHGLNTLRLSVRSVRPPSGKPLRDADRVAFRASTGPNTKPVARFTVEPDVVLTNVPIAFDGSASEDADGDDLSYHWDFGDGTTADGPTATHAFADGGQARVVTLTVSDGQEPATALDTLPSAPPCDAAALPGTIHVEADGPLEVGPVQLGQTGTRTFVVRNLDATPGSQVKASLASDSAAFQLSLADVTLGPGESMPVTVTFAPTIAGHQTARIEIGACATDQGLTTLVAHGFGGVAPGTGPTLAHDPAFELALVDPTHLGIVETRPDGTRFPITLDLPWCALPDGTGTHDLCTRNRDCNANGENCVAAPAGQSQLDVVDFCGDGQNLFVLSDVGSTDNRGLDEEIVGVLARVGLDASGQRNANDAILRRVTDGTAHMACDARPIAAGLVFLAEFHAVDPGANCVRDGREALVSVRKSNGSYVATGVDRIDAVEGLDACDDDLDRVDWLGVRTDGTGTFMEPDNRGIWGVTPTAGLLLNDFGDKFQVHRDGSLLLATASDSGTTSVIDLYKIDPAQAATGALRLDQLTPCARLPLPNNARPGDGTPHLQVGSIAADPNGDPDPTVLVTIVSTTGAAPIADALRLRATAAFAVPSEGTTCSVLGLVNLDAPDGLTF